MGDPVGMTPGPQMQSGPEPTPWWEDAAIILAIISLWPAVLGWEDQFWRWVLCASATVMLFVFVRRIRRFRRLRQHQQSQLPFMPGNDNEDLN